MSSPRTFTAFNHRTSVEIESEYDRLRAEARAEGDKMKRYFDEVCFRRTFHPVFFHLISSHPIPSHLLVHPISHITKTTPHPTPTCIVE